MIQKDKTTFSEPCRICSASEWLILYEGPIRIGKFGEYSKDNHVVWKCSKCQSGFIARTPLDYEKSDYREMVDGSDKPSSFYKLHDKEMVGKLKILGTDNIRGKVIADAGCGAGPFLDLIKGFASKTIAVEPTKSFHHELRAKGHVTYSYSREALKDWSESVDIVVSFAVVEHIENPIEFLKEIKSLLKPNGFLLLGTPNTDDWLLEFLPGIYDRFFYRYVHTWYFNRESIQSLSQRAGFKETEILFKQRFDISNALHWARDNTPTGTGKFNLLQGMDSTYIQLIESLGRSDYIYARMYK
jgi:2-polyprenyl-3-methyl-5-hydroxy-6-metoxy-1,4-benzoquinol methylase